jgi:DNA-binding transcriptional MerR regulator
VRGPRLSDLLDTDGFAAACGVRPGTVRQWVKRGKVVPVAKLNGGHVFTVRQIEEVRR